MQTENSSEVSVNLREQSEIPTVELTGIANPTLARLIAEVQNAEGATLGAYDRAHNRHNR